MVIEDFKSSLSTMNRDIQRKDKWRQRHQEKQYKLNVPKRHIAFHQMIGYVLYNPEYSSGNINIKIKIWSSQVSFPITAKLKKEAKIGKKISLAI